jgi:hypothetical protein
MPSDQDRRCVWRSRSSRPCFWMASAAKPPVCPLPPRETIEAHQPTRPINNLAKPEMVPGSFLASPVRARQPICGQPTCWLRRRKCRQHRGQSPIHLRAIPALSRNGFNWAAAPVPASCGHPRPMPPGGPRRSHRSARWRNRRPFPALSRNGFNWAAAPVPASCGHRRPIPPGPSSWLGPRAGRWQGHQWLRAQPTRKTARLPGPEPAASCSD